MKTDILNKLTELGLFLFIILFPFSYSTIDFGHASINMFVALLLCFVFFIKRYNILTFSSWKVFLAIMFIYIFDFTEKINFIQQFGLTVEITKMVPLSTILLSILFLVYLINFLVNKNTSLPNQSFAKYFFITCLFLFVLVLMFYPLLYIQYQMGLKSDLQLLNKIAKYLIILLVVTNYIDNETKVRRLSVPLMISLGLTSMISLIFIIINIK
jgi:hypothetical protein